MASFPKSLKELCKPSLVYFIISMMAVVIILFQNLGNNNTYNIGYYSCNVSNNIIFFIFKIIYILFWTYILNLICKDGHKGLSWLLVLFPFLHFFVLIGIFLLSNY
jgi:hypothetical protein